MTPPKLPPKLPSKLRDDAEYEAAAAELGTLLDLDPAAGTAEYDRLEALTVLIAAYDAEHIRFGEDAADLALMDEANKEPGPDVPWEELRAELNPEDGDR